MTQAPTAPTDTLSNRVAVELLGWLGKRRISQAKLARALNVSPMYVSDRLAGKTPINLNDLERMCAVLHIDPIDVLRAAASTTDRYPVGAHAVDVRSPRAAGTRSRFRQAVAT